MNNNSPVCIFSVIKFIFKFKNKLGKIAEEDYISLVIWLNLLQILSFSLEDGILECTLLLQVKTVMSVA